MQALRARLPDGAEGGTRSPHLIGRVRFVVQAASFVTFVVLISGALCSFRVGATLVEPLGFFQMAAASKLRVGFWVVAGAIVFVAIFTVTRRAFCGWICPVGFLLDVVDTFAARGARSAAGRQKEALAVAVIVSSAATGTPVWCAVCPIGAVCRGVGLSGIVAPLETALLTSLALVPEFRSKRWFCRNVCPVAGIINILSKPFPGLRVEVDPELCTSCKACERVCPTGAIGGNFDECILCLKCYERCPKGAIKIKI